MPAWSPPVQKPVENTRRRAPQGVAAFQNRKYKTLGILSPTVCWKHRRKEEPILTFLRPGGRSSEAVCCPGPERGTTSCCSRVSRTCRCASSAGLQTTSNSMHMTSFNFECEREPTKMIHTKKWSSHRHPCQPYIVTFSCRRRAQAERTEHTGAAHKAQLMHR